MLGHLSDLVRKFVEEACLKHNLSPEAAKKAGGKIYTYGSYRLGVHGPATDIDTLIVGPKHVDRQDFNEIFLRMLEQDPIVSEVSVSLLCPQPPSRQFTRLEIARPRCLCSHHHDQDKRHPYRLHLRASRPRCHS